ncbi:hypothetical protein [Streptomyces akebiae]|uniref:Transposase n=1 Tax=Streptomyces akebiae TaxID=2865673 RepID=A0ABX8XJC2_9ACTN|nr:hypothetical protein [Streptomyces akebiae]QYX75718.1 hypothetical protein K1J60_03600 [Streptomyces akebiae]
MDASDARLHPRGTGVELLRSYVLIQLAEATCADMRRRLKVCATPHRRGAFYARSKNCSRLSHPVTNHLRQHPKGTRLPARLKGRELSTSR